ncbi:IclR family transcriptional regulator [Deinococcus sp.]|uniref:IclR family transcriptional regulator n=1 Tax=Deinococcus sp. TaxID=47478 RepID=UPI003B5B9F21
MSVIGSVERVGQVLDLYTREQPEWGVTQVAARLGVSKSSAHALLSTLSGLGLLHRTPENRYQLGWRLVALSRVLLEGTPITQMARPVMERLVHEFGETVHLGALEAGRVIYLEKLQGNRAVRVEMTGVGAELWAHSSGLGKVLLSHLPESEVRASLTWRGLPRFTPSTITDLDELLSLLPQVRAQGHAYDIEEFAPELCCVAAPIYNHASAVVAALSFSVPAYRFYESKPTYRAAILEAAREVSERLGFVSPHPLEAAWTPH